MTGDAGLVFVDTNVLVYSTIVGAALHDLARRTIQQLRDSGADLWISRQVLREYVATLTRPQTFPRALPIVDVVADVRRFATELRIAEDSAEVTDQLLWILEGVSVGGRQIHDANIVATMRAYHIGRLLTHNVDDFARYERLITVIPLQPNE